LSFASLQQRDVMVLERSKTQITPPSHLFVGEKQNSNHTTIRSLWLREAKLKSLHHQISLVERSKGGVICVLLLSTKEI
jgi:hypothetical protein